MNNVFYSLLLMFYTFSLSGQLEVRFDNLVPKPSKLIIALYTSGDSFTTEDVFYSQELIVEAGVERLRWHLPSLPIGSYALSVYQDLNFNKKLDKGMFGAPREPYGFSRNPKIVFKAPAFEDCNFEYEGTKLDLQINLIQN